MLPQVGSAPEAIYEPLLSDKHQGTYDSVGEFLKEKLMPCMMHRGSVVYIESFSLSIDEILRTVLCLKSQFRFVGLTKQSAAVGLLGLASCFLVILNLDGVSREVVVVGQAGAVPGVHGQDVAYKEAQGLVNA